MRYERNVQFSVASPDRWEEYEAVFANSALYDHYFKGTDGLKNIMSDALQEGRVIAAQTTDGEIAGIMVYDMKGMYGEFPYLALLGVKDSCRGQSIGSRLIDIFVNLSKQAGCSKCFLCVSHFNPRAKALYVRKGFRPVVLIPNMIRRGIDEWTMMKCL